MRAIRGTNAAALYTTSTVALNPDTGKLAWYFQHVPGESLDLDAVYERVLLDSGGQNLLFTIGKDGIPVEARPQGRQIPGLQGNRLPERLRQHR